MRSHPSYPRRGIQLGKISEVDSAPVAMDCEESSDRRNLRNSRLCKLHSIEGRTSMIRRVLLLLLVIAVAGCSNAPDNQKAEQPAVSPAATPAGQDDAKWAVTDGINAPESVYVDTEDGFI